MRSRGTDNGPGAVRDLIEAGLNEPADAAATYGISTAALNPGGCLGAVEYCDVGAVAVESGAKQDRPASLQLLLNAEVAPRRVVRHHGRHKASLRRPVLMR